MDNHCLDGVFINLGFFCHGDEGHARVVRAVVRGHMEFLYDFIKAVAVLIVGYFV